MKQSTEEHSFLAAFLPISTKIWLTLVSTVLLGQVYNLDQSWKWPYFDQYYFMGGKKKYENKISLCIPCSSHRCMF